MDEKIIKQAAKHIIYEIQMFHFTYNKLHAKGIEPMVKNAMIESCVIHAYNLFRFFYQGENEYKKDKAASLKKGKIIYLKRPRKSTDMIAEDYIEKRAVFKGSRVPKRFFSNLERKRNKQMAHLTYNRVKMKGWDKKMFERLWETVDVFLISLPENHKELFADIVKTARHCS